MTMRQLVYSIIFLMVLFSSHNTMGQSKDGDCIDCKDEKRKTSLRKSMVQTKAWDATKKVETKTRYRIQVFVLTNRPDALPVFGHLNTFYQPVVFNSKTVYIVYVDTVYNTYDEADLIRDTLLKENYACEAIVVPFGQTAF